MQTVGAVPVQPGYPEVVSAFSDIAEAIGGEVELDALLHLVAERICSLLSVSRASVYLRDPKTEMFRGQVGHADRDIDLAIKRLTPGIEADGFTREILDTLRPVLLVNAQSDPRPVRSTILHFDVHALLGVPMVLRGEVIGLLFLDNEDRPHEFTAEQQELALSFGHLAAIAISQAQLTRDLRATLSTAAQQNAMLRRAASLEERLTNLVLEGANLAEIAAAVTELTGKPCAIHDADHRPLAQATPPGVGDPPRMFDAAALGEPAVREALVTLSARRPAVVPALPAVGLPQRSLVAVVRVGSEDWGYLVLGEHRGRFGAQDAIVARRTATIIALELSGKQRAAEAEKHAVEALARDLVHGSDDPASLARRADYHGLALGEPHVVVLLSLREEAPRGGVTPFRVAKVFHDVAPQLRAFVAGVEKGAAVVLEAPAAPSPAEKVRAVRGVVEEALARLAPDGSVTASISTLCRGVGDYPGAYEQARQVSRGISTFGAPGRCHVVAADDLGAGRLLLATADRSEADRFVRDTLGALLDTREPSLNALFVTLEAFLECSRSVRRAAAALDVHENTVRYRLARVSEITGLDIVSDGDVQLAVQLALLILRLEDRLGLPEPALRR